MKKFFFIWYFGAVCYGMLLTYNDAAYEEFKARRDFSRRQWRESKRYFSDAVWEYRHARMRGETPEWLDSIVDAFRKERSASYFSDSMERYRERIHNLKV